MTARACHRRFEVEAARDGRLTGAARASIEEHASTCEVCAGEDRKLRSVASALVGLPVGKTDSLTVRRQRQRILALFNDAQVTSAVRRTSRRRAVGAMLTAGAFAALVALVATRSHRVAPSTPLARVADRADDVVVVVRETARWSRADEGTNTRVKLDEGELDIHVKHNAEAHGLLVTLPDGELEDIGTTFRVRVQSGHTVAVVVREGAVVFRREDAGPVLLGAGESWTADGPSRDASSSAAAPSGPTAAASAAPSPATWTKPAPADSAKSFRDGVDLLNEGNDAEAAAAFRAYLSQGPTAERAEDATYLLVLALHRAGDGPSAQAAARDYATLYPHGLRLKEVQHLVPEAAR